MLQLEFNAVWNSPSSLFINYDFQNVWAAVMLFNIFKTSNHCNPKKIQGSIQGGPRTTELLVIWKIFTKQVELKKQWWNPPSRWQTKHTQKVYAYALRNKALGYFFVCISQILKVLLGPFYGFPIFSLYFLPLPHHPNCWCHWCHSFGWGWWDGIFFFLSSKPFKKHF